MQSRLPVPPAFDLVACKAILLEKGDSEFKLPLISGAGFSVLLNSEAFAVVRAESREGLKERNTREASKISLVLGGCRAVEDQCKPLTHVEDGSDCQ